MSAQDDAPFEHWFRTEVDDTSADDVLWCWACYQSHMTTPWRHAVMRRHEARSHWETWHDETKGDDDDAARSKR